jgi:ferredoxin
MEPWGCSCRACQTQVPDVYELYDEAGVTMDFVPSEYRSFRSASVAVWHHPEEKTDVVTALAALTGNLIAAMEVELGHRLSCALDLCVYHTNDDAIAALGRNVPATMLMAPRLGPDWSLIVCQSPNVDHRNGDWPRMRRHLAHEIAHVMLADLTGSTRRLGDDGRSMRVRAWFDEGFAEVAAAVVCGRPDIIEQYPAATSQAAWSEDELDAALDDIGSPARPAAFVEAVRRVQAGLRSRTLRDAVHELEAGVRP